jgi:hypothetical protein
MDGEQREIPEERSSGAEQAAEKGLLEDNNLYQLLQRLKPVVDMVGLIGPTKVRPCYKAL